MSGDASPSPVDLSMLGILRTEADGQTEALTSGLLELERDPKAAASLESCMRAAHSLKGACRIVGLSAGVELAHAMEDCFVAAQEGRPALNQERIDLLLRGVDLLHQMAQTPEREIGRWTGKLAEVDDFVSQVNHSLAGEKADKKAGEKENVFAEPIVEAPKSDLKSDPKSEKSPASVPVPETGATDRVLRVTAENLNRLLALAGESVVESSRLKPFSETLLRLRRLHQELARTLEKIDGGTAANPNGGPGRPRLEADQAEAKLRLAECQRFLQERLSELDEIDRRSADLARRLYDEALAIRMRPFVDGLQGFHRLVRDLGHSLGKKVRLEVEGRETRIDRDILEQLKAPLDHLLRNAVDHGVESPEERLKAGKPEEAVIRLEARHSAGALQVFVSDDGRGVDLDRLRHAVVERQLADAAVAANLSESELLEFLFLPGFTMKGRITDISGRGVGLDVVRNVVRQVRGIVRAANLPASAGGGTRFHLQLPLTLSVVRSLLVEIGGEPYAFPLARVVRAMKVPQDRIESLEGRPHAALEGRRVGLVSAGQALGGGTDVPAEGEWPVIVLGDPENLYGLVVDRFLGERELVVQPLDARLGKIRDIAAASLMEDGTPVLIVDTDDLIRSVEKLTASGRPEGLHRSADPDRRRRKRILVVDDSLTVRELERKLLGNWGYEVEVAVDGMDGWNVVRGSQGRFDLVVSDVDMPRLDGIELVRLIKQDPNLKSLPVMIVSYKDREEDRRRGLEAGADYYLAKGNFQDEKLLQTVVDLIGPAQA